MWRGLLLAPPRGNDANVGPVCELLAEEGGAVEHEVVGALAAQRRWKASMASARRSRIRPSLLLLRPSETSTRPKRTRPYPAQSRLRSAPTLIAVRLLTSPMQVIGATATRPTPRASRTR